MFDILLQLEKEFSIEQSKKTLTCKNNGTNIFMYINEKSRLLHNIKKNKWNHFLNIYKIKKRKVPKKSLRFTITDMYLKKYPRKDKRGIKMKTII